MRIQTMLLPCEGNRVEFAIVLDEIDVVHADLTPKQEECIKDRTGAVAVLTFTQHVDVV